MRNEVRIVRRSFSVWLSVRQSRLVIAMIVMNDPSRFFSFWASNDLIELEFELVCGLWVLFRSNDCHSEPYWSLCESWCPSRKNVCPSFHYCMASNLNLSVAFVDFSNHRTSSSRGSVAFSWRDKISKCAIVIVRCMFQILRSACMCVGASVCAGV